MRVPGIVHADDIADNRAQCGLPDGRYVAARPEPFFSVWQRWKASWLVFTGRADAVIWTEQ